ncbi:hypothetical protein AB1N83_009772 [Pleurotus pulmonarius]
MCLMSLNSDRPRPSQHVLRTRAESWLESILSAFHTHRGIAQYIPNVLLNILPRLDLCSFDGDLNNESIRSAPSNRSVIPAYSPGEDVLQDYIILKPSSSSIENTSTKNLQFFWG